MDPIHPIVPLPPTIPPVTPTPLVGRIDRDNPRGRAGQDKGRRQRENPEHGSEPLGNEVGHVVEESDGEDGSGLHINITA